MEVRRRDLLAGGLALLVPWFGLGAASPAPGRKLVVVVLRGALDGLAAAPPTADPRYRELRGALALGDPGTPGGALALSDGLGLHPALGFLHERWLAGELGVLHAAATPYRERSHFDAQDVLERGALLGPDEGWLARALVGRGAAGVGIGVTVPLLLRGQAKVSTWAPSRGPEVDEGTLDRLADLYAEAAPALAADLASARATDALMGDSAGSSRARGAAAVAPTFRSAATLLTAEGGPDAAVVEIGGWDTHAGQGAVEGSLARRLASLDEGLRALRDGLGEVWGRTAVLVITEFGRTVRVNGTGGTDHGTGGVAFAVGGAVKGRVLGDWPGLAQLHEDRDLRPVNDLRALLAGVLGEHWGLDEPFPGVRPLTGLIRT